jgi:hypothetical protein
LIIVPDQFANHAIALTRTVLNGQRHPAPITVAPLAQEMDRGHIRRFQPVREAMSGRKRRP